jgi:hypothetical protein
LSSDDGAKTTSFLPSPTKSAEEIWQVTEGKAEEREEVLLSERRCEDGGTEEDEDRSEDGFGREDGGLEQRRRER